MALYGSNAKKFIKCTSNGLPKREDENGNRIIINKNAIDMRRLYNIALSDNGTERSMSDIVIEEYQKKRIVNKTFSETEDPNKKRKLNRFQEILDMNKR